MKTLLGKTLTEAQLHTCFTFYGADSLPARRFTSYLWNDISSGAMHITDFAEKVTGADLQAAITGTAPRGDPWATRLYAALILATPSWIPSPRMVTVSPSLADSSARSSEA